MFKIKVKFTTWDLEKRLKKNLDPILRKLTEITFQNWINMGRTVSKNSRVVQDYISALHYFRRAPNHYVVGLMAGRPLAGTTGYKSSSFYPLALDRGLVMPVALREFQLKRGGKRMIPIGGHDAIGGVNKDSLRWMSQNQPAGMWVVKRIKSPKHLREKIIDKLPSYINTVFSDLLKA